MRAPYAGLAILLGLALFVAPAAAAAQSPRAIEQDGALPAEGTNWRLRDYRYRGVERTSGPEVAAWLTLRDGQLRGSGGCGAIQGRYALMGAAIDIRLDSDGRTDCAEQTVLVELGMIDGLRRAASLRIESASEDGETGLELLDAQGERLLGFEPDDVSTLEGTRWQLEAWTIDGARSAALSDQVSLLTFERERGRERERYSTGELVGTAGCNAIVAEYYRYADVISFGELTRTDAPCSDAAAAQEQAMVAVLDATSSTLRLPPDHLMLASADGSASLEFVSTTPLEGTTWLVRIPGSVARTEPLTLRLDDGRASGEGPCGAYSASYATDGLFLSFADIGGAANPDCDSESIEQAILAALRHTSLTERTGTRTRFMDPRGRVRLVLSAAGRP